MALRQVFCVVLITLSKTMPSSCDCSTVFWELKAFGTDCQYLCHCKNTTEQCHNVTGDCDSGCSTEWTGPGCQYRNVAPEFTRNIQYSEPHPGFPAINAIDGDPSTCIESNETTDDSYHYFNGKQAFTVSYHVSRVILHIPEEALYNFISFKIRTTRSGSIIYQWPISKPITPVMEVAFDTPKYFLEITIELHIKNVPILLCELQIIVGRDVSFNRPVNFSSEMPGWEGHRAVDGKFPQISVPNEGMCFTSNTSGELEPWWSVDLGHVYDLYHVRSAAKTHSTTVASCSVGVNEASMVQVFQRRVNYRMTSVGSTPLPGQFAIVKTVLPENTTGSLDLCEFQILGDCPTGQCGFDCSRLCMCSVTSLTLAEKFNGTCPSGCTGRWTGETEELCNLECYDTWDQNCSRACGHCADPRCDMLTGLCSNDGCAGPWQPPLCTAECVDGKFGTNCGGTCGQCFNSTACNKTTGMCPGICEAGWKEPFCLTECPLKTYGGRCTRCGKCKGEVPCDRGTGECPQGLCEIGWQPPFCESPCSNSTYGNQCVEKCSVCYGDEVCEPATGLCLSGLCGTGYQGPKCQEECGNATYGLNCSLSCGHCEGPLQCDHITGVCPWGCHLDFEGHLCSTEKEKPHSFLTGLYIGITVMLIIGIAVLAFGSVGYKRHLEKVDEEDFLKKLKEEECSVEVSENFKGNAKEVDSFLRSI